MTTQLCGLVVKSDNIHNDNKSSNDKHKSKIHLVYKQNMTLYPNL